MDSVNMENLVIELFTGSLNILDYFRNSCEMTEKTPNHL